MWEIEGTNDFAEWYVGLPEAQRAALAERIDLLAERGPSLGRPVVDSIAGSRVHNMKELRGGTGRHVLRVLFVFDPRRSAILLLGGNKAADSVWNAWYVEAIPRAEELYASYLDETDQE